MANVTIDILTEFKGKPAFKQAETSLDRLTSLAKKAGLALGIEQLTEKTIEFGKKSVEAFMADQKAAAQLSNTVKNLGLSFADADIKDFVDKLSLSSGEIKDELDPAMQKFLQISGDVAKSQDLLKRSIDISRGSGVDLATVVSDLSASYLGNNKGLKKYALGLSKAQLQTASFDTVLQKFNENFAGANAAYLDTYAGKLALVKNAAHEAEVSIGSGLVDAFKILAGDTNIQDLSDKIATLGQNIGDFFRGLAKGFNDLANFPIIHQLIQLAGFMLKIAGKVGGAVVGGFVDAGKTIRLAGQTQAEKLSAAAKAKAEAAAKKRAADLAKAQKAQTQALKDQSALKKAQAVFDLQQIELVAALQGKLSDQDRKRAEAQLALLAGNDALAEKLTNEILLAQDSTGKLSDFLSKLPSAKNPFSDWDAYLTAIEERIKKLNLNPPGGGGGGNGIPQVYGLNIPLPTTNAEAIAQGNDVTGFNRFGVTTSGGQTIRVDLNVDGKTLAQVMQDASLSGNQVYVNRLTGSFYQ